MVTEHLRSRRLHESAPEIQRRGDHAPTPRRVSFPALWLRKT